MSEVHDITSTATKTAVLKKFAKRTVVASAITVAAAALYLKTRSNDGTSVETPSA